MNWKQEYCLMFLYGYCKHWSRTLRMASSLRLFPPYALSSLYFLVTTSRSSRRSFHSRTSSFSCYLLQKTRWYLANSLLPLSNLYTLKLLLYSYNISKRPKNRFYAKVYILFYICTYT